MGDFTFNEQLRQLLIELNLTQLRCAKICDIPLSTLKSWLSAEESKRHRALPSVQFYFIKMKIMLRNQDGPHQKQGLSASIDSILYHLENAMLALQSKDYNAVAEYLKVAIDDANFAYFANNELKLDPLTLGD